MKRLLATVAVGIAATLALASTASAAPEFGFENFDVTFTNADGSPATQAGSHPFAMTTDIVVKAKEGPNGFVPAGELKDMVIEQIGGLVGDATAYPRCSDADFSDLKEARHPQCPNDTAVGVVAAYLFQPPPFAWGPAAVYNLEPPPGVVARLGFNVSGVPVTVDVGVSGSAPFDVSATTFNFPQPIVLFGAKFQLWGYPADPAHDPVRGDCIKERFGFGEVDFMQARSQEMEEEGTVCPATRRPEPFLTLPTNCLGPETTTYAIASWQNPGAFLVPGVPDLSDPAWVTGSTVTHDFAEPQNPIGFTGCGRLQFKPSIASKPTTKAAQSPTGLDFALNVHDEGLRVAAGLSQSEIRKTVVTLPEGMSANPSLAEGLNVCTEADLKRETAFSEPGAGCPDGSKIGTVEVESPLLDQTLEGSLYIAKPYENQFNSLLAIYIVIKNPQLGIVLKQAGNVERDPQTGQLTTVVDNIPQLPFSRFNLHFREGTRSPLVSPPVCGDHEVKALLYPWSGGAPVVSTSTFQIISGANNTPCPRGDLPPFKPGLIAGSINNAAGRYSPFNVRIFRNDGEQEITHFSIKLPPGLLGKLAGIPFCPDSAIAAAKARTGATGGEEELNSPSCPAASEIGHTLVGAGVGPALAYAPGKVYLAGPYHGSALSIVAITAAKVGPFDLGTVVVREALKINPETAEVSVDATGSDPIPHIIQGIPVHLRDIRVYVDRPNFVLNPTNCTPTATAATILGSGLNFASETDDNPVTVATRYQAADCASLPFGPKLSLTLRGGTRRGQVPAVRAVVTARPGEANIKKAVVALPTSEFLEQGHIGTVCTRIEFAEGSFPGEKCPAGAVYGHASAITPLLDEPITGPVFLRSNGGERQLPDLVAALHSGKININLVGFIDSAAVKGSDLSQIRNTFANVPDAPVSKFTLNMVGGKKGLLVNSTNICRGKHRAKVSFTGQNGKLLRSTSVLKAKCHRKKGKRHHGKRGAHRHRRGR